MLQQLAALRRSVRLATYEAISVWEWVIFFPDVAQLDFIYPTASSLSHQQFRGPEFQPHDHAQWHTLGTKMSARYEARREQNRFRMAPVEYLAALEEKLYQQTMQS